MINEFMISFLENLSDSNEKLVTKRRMLNKVAKHKINYKALIVVLFLFTKNRCLENIVRGNHPNSKTN